MSKDKNTFWDDFKKDFIAGSASGAAVTLATQPLDTIAVRAQAGTNKPGASFNQAFKPVSEKASKGKSLKNLYKGLTPRLIKSTAAGAVGYPVFMGVSRLLEDDKEKNAALIQKALNSPGHLTRMYHSANPAEFASSRSMKTGDAIDYLSSTWMNRPINIGRGKYKKDYTKVAFLGAARGLFSARTLVNARNFGRGVMWSTKGTSLKNMVTNPLKNKFRYAGLGTSMAPGAVAPKIKNTKLEKAMLSPSSNTLNTFN